MHSAQCTSLLGQIPTCHTTRRCTASCYAKQFNHPERVEIANNEALQLIVLFSVASQLTAFKGHQADLHCVENERLEPENLSLDCQFGLSSPSRTEPGSKDKSPP